MVGLTGQSLPALRACAPSRGKAWAKPRRHRCYTLAFAGKQQAGAIGLQRSGTVEVPRGMRQAIEVSREAFRLGAWR
jgi:hypothetical protein